MKNNKKIIIALGALLLLLTVASILYAADGQKHNYKPKEGYVPNEETAIRIAVAVWIPIYGKEQIENEKPYKAILKDGIWYVTGSLPKSPEGYVVVGGVAEAEINKEDGKILRISHGK